jgi:hypothetical protein
MRGCWLGLSLRLSYVEVWPLQAMTINVELATIVTADCLPCGDCILLLLPAGGPRRAVGRARGPNQDRQWPTGSGSWRALLAHLTETIDNVGMVELAAATAARVAWASAFFDL